MTTRTIRIICGYGALFLLLFFIGIPIVQHENREHRQQACAQVDIVRQAIDAYATDHGGEYPPSSNDYKQLLNMLGPYLPADNTYPGWKAFRDRETVFYCRSGDGNSFSLIAKSLASPSSWVMASATRYAEPISDADANRYLAAND